MKDIESLTNSIVYLIGFPGSGKLTISKVLNKMFPSIIVDNHMSANVVFSLIDTDGVTKLPDIVWDNISKIREIMFDTMVNCAKPDKNFILTNALIDGGDLDIFERVEQFAKDRNAKFYVFRLLVDVEELCKRVSSPERYSQLKEVSVELARNRSLNEKVLIPQNCKYFDLDTTSLTAKQSAEAIVNIIEESK